MREYVDVHLGDVHTRNRAEQTHGNDEDDCQGQRPALVQSGQHQEDGRDGERKDHHGGVAGKQLQIGHVGPFIGHGLGKLLVGDPLHDLDHFSGTHAGRRVAID